MENCCRSSNVPRRKQLSSWTLVIIRSVACTPEIVKLTSLQSLNLWSNQLSSLPPEIVKLTSLQSLNLWSNQLSSPPPEIGKLEQLKTIDLRGNPIPIPPEILGPKQSWIPPGDQSSQSVR
jgi:Leucine-rich repeat (LRR) protein